LIFFFGFSLGFGRIFVFLWLWFGRLGGCIGVFGWSLFDLGVFVFSLGVGWSVLWSLNMVSLVSSSVSSSSLARLAVSCVIYEIFVVLLINILQ